VSQGKKIWNYGDPQDYTVIFDTPSHYQSYIVKDGTIDMISVHAEPPTRGDELVFGDSQFVEDWEPYMLPRMLGTYGQPPQVLLGVGPGVPWVPFDLLLFYPDEGILVRYEAPAERGEGVFRMCPYKTDITLWLWSPHTDRRHIADWESMIGGESYFRSLAEATGLSIEQFYQTFSQPDNQTCLETPADLWGG
jgi:hypothetical protein